MNKEKDFKEKYNNFLKLKQYDNAAKMFDDIINLYKKNEGNEKKLLTKLIEKGSFYLRYKADYYIVLSTMKSALQLAEKLQSNYYLAYIYSTIGYAYRHLTNYDQALTFFELARDYASRVNSENIIISSINEIANIHFFKGDYSKSLQMHKKALSIAQDFKLEKYITFISHDIGILYYTLKKFEKADQYFIQAFQHLEDSIGTYQYAQIITSYAQNLISLGHYSNAEKKLQKALQLEENIQNHELKLEIFYSLATIYEKQNKINEANRIWMKYIPLFEKNSSISLNKKISEIQAQLDYESKVKEAEFEKIKNIELKKKNASLHNHQSHLRMVNKILRHDLTDSINNAILFSEKIIQDNDQVFLKKLKQKVTESVDTIVQMRELEIFLTEHENVKIWDLNELLSKIFTIHKNITFHIKGKGKIYTGKDFDAIFEKLIRSRIEKRKSDQFKITITNMKNYTMMQVEDNGVIFENDYYVNECKKFLEQFGGFLEYFTQTPQGMEFIFHFKQAK